MRVLLWCWVPDGLQPGFEAPPHRGGNRHQASTTTKPEHSVNRPEHPGAASKKRIWYAEVFDEAAAAARAAARRRNHDSASVSGHLAEPGLEHHECDGAQVCEPEHRPLTQRHRRRCPPRRRSPPTTEQHVKPKCASSTTSAGTDTTWRFTSGPSGWRLPPPGNSCGRSAGPGCRLHVPRAVAVAPHAASRRVQFGVTKAWRCQNAGQPFTAVKAGLQ